MGDTIFGLPANTENAFDAAYKASLPPALQALMLMDPSNAPDGTNPRAIKAGQLALQGYIIDVPIMAWNWDPYATMYSRQLQGDNTVKDGLGQVDIKVSTDPSDYPAYVAPPAPVDPSENYIGDPIGTLPYAGAHWFAVQPGTMSLANGTIMEHRGHTLQLHVMMQQTGLSSAAVQKTYVWTQISA